MDLVSPRRNPFFVVPSRVLIGLWLLQSISFRLLFHFPLPHTIYIEWVRKLGLFTRLDLAYPLFVGHLELGIKQHVDCKSIDAYERAVRVATRAPEAQAPKLVLKWHDSANRHKSEGT